MIIRKIIAASTVMSALLASTAVHADVTAEDVWQSMVDYYAEFGAAELSGDAQRSGDTLTVSGVTYSQEMPEGSIVASAGDIQFIELGDGTVQVALPETMPVEFTVNSGEGDIVVGQISLHTPGMSTIVSGSPDELTIETDAPEMRLTIDSIVVEDEEIQIEGALAMTGTRGSYDYARLDDGAVSVISEGYSDALSFSFSLSDPMGNGHLDMSGEWAELGSSSEMIMPADINMEDMPAALAAGMEMAVAGDFGASSYSIEFEDGSDSFMANGNGTGGGLEFSLSRDGVVFAGTGGMTEVSVTTSELPFPINVSLAESAIRTEVPMSASDEPVPFIMLLKLIELNIPEEIWGMGDPMGQLPHDPATVIIDISGMAKLLVDLTNPEEAAMMGMGMPGELHSINLNELQVSVVGVDLTGKGSFTFDNDDMSMGFPKPLGAAELALKGGNALLDKLVGMGLLPEDQAMGARMMMGMFAVPAGEDELTSKVEFREDGGFYANGQRLQ